MKWTLLKWRSPMYFVGTSRSSTWATPPSTCPACRVWEAGWWCPNHATNRMAYINQQQSTNPPNKPKKNTSKSCTLLKFNIENCQIQGSTLNFVCIMARSPAQHSSPHQLEWLPSYSHGTWTWTPGRDSGFGSHPGIIFRFHVSFGGCVYNQNVWKYLPYQLVQDVVLHQ